MSFYKKVLALKQIEYGFSLSNKPIGVICRIEIENGVAELSLTCVNVCPKEGVSYKFMIVDDCDIAHSFDCGKQPSTLKFSFSTFPSVKGDISAGLYAVSGDIPITISFSCEDNSKCNVYEFKRIVAEKCLQERRTQSDKIKPVPVSEPKPQNPPITEPNDDQKVNVLPKNTKTVTEIYDDEAVATANYYEFESQIDERLSLVKELDDERIRLSNVTAVDTSQKETQEWFKKDNFSQNETNASVGEEYSKSRPYYQTVKNDLESVFEKFPEEKGLKNLFPQSKWAKIHYSKNNFYVVGVIKENRKEKYICYGVPDKYSPTPPKELKGYCTFIPLSVFDLSGDGYWMMFQDAVTGDCVKPKPPFDK